MRIDEIRESLMQVVYQMEALSQFELNEINLLDENSKLNSDPNAQSILKAISQNIESIDNIINNKTEGWDIRRIGKVELAILRLAACEILYFDEIPLPVSINEAVELSKIYCEPKSYKFINSVLSKIGENNARL